MLYGEGPVSSLLHAIFFPEPKPRTEAIKLRAAICSLKKSTTERSNFVAGEYFVLTNGLNNFDYLMVEAELVSD